MRHCGKIIALMVMMDFRRRKCAAVSLWLTAFGLLTDEMPNLLDFQRDLVTPRASIAHWDTESAQLSLMDVVRNVHPTVLIGVWPAGVI